MTGQELWIEVFAFETVAEVIEVAKEAGETVEATVAVNVQEWINLCGDLEGETVESITAKLMKFIADSTPLKGFTAYHKIGGCELELPIIEVPAVDVEQAKTRIEQELQKPGRDMYLERWERDGRIVKETR